MARFADIRGQDRVVAMLQRIAASQRLGHAYLFHGPAGCGRRLTAQALVTSLFCASGAGCGSCSSCRKLAGGQHPDLRLLEPDGQQIKIDQVRHLQQELALRPYEAPRKACIIDGADRFHPAAANALLKTLEEPPGNALLLLLAENLESVLPTIRSRCQELRFAPLGEAVLVDLLHARGIDGELAHTVAPLADGSIGRALELAAVQDDTSRHELLQRLLCLGRRDLPALFAAAEEYAKEREQAAAVLETLLGAFRDLLAAQAGGLEVPADLASVTAGNNLPPARLVALLERLLDLRRALVQNNSNPRLTLEVAFLELAEYR